MTNTKTLLVACTISISALFATTGCGTNVTRADIPSTANPQEELTKLSTDVGTAVSKNVDVLAPDEFKDMSKYFNKAKSGLAKNDKQEDVIENIRISRGYLQAAYNTADRRAESAPGVFEARQAARNAHASELSLLQKEWRDVDADVSDDADRLQKLSTEELANLQARYVELERKAVIITNLGDAQAAVNGSRANGAAKRAPVTFKKAELSLKNAESAISTSVKNPEGYKAAVATAKADSQLLMEVWRTQQAKGKDLSEDAALTMVDQNRKIAALTNEASASAQDEQAQAARLAKQNQDLKAAQQQVNIQRAIEQARAQFTEDEAEAYQQGENLVIRLKKINFPSGKSDLPQTSLPVLAKVGEVAKTLGAASILVEGHTDSIGTDVTNMKISDKRANAVATYLKANGFEDIEILAEGYGFQKPIATNKSKEGRAQNRRVDIVITPEAPTITQ